MCHYIMHLESSGIYMSRSEVKWSLVLSVDIITIMPLYYKIQLKLQKGASYITIETILEAL